MGSSTFWLFSILTLLPLLFSASSSMDSPPAATITLPLTSKFPSKRSMKPMDFFKHLASSSLARAHYLKYGKTSPPDVQTSVSPHSSGIHTIPLSFGTPPQKLSYEVDTGSHVVWAPCTTQFKCINCSFSNGDPSTVPIFNPKLSSSFRVLGCRDPKCFNGCPRCNPSSKNCTHHCPPYNLVYGIGEVSGDYLLEKLEFPGKIIPNFVFGCTTIAAREADPEPLAGFGRSVLSLPMQMGLKKFAYCLKSHAYDDSQERGKLIFDYRDGQTKGLSYTPFLNNPPDYPVYYYLGAEYIMMGKNLLSIPSKYLVPSSQGTGGVIIDSGIGSAGYMAGPVLKVLSKELNRQMSEYRRSPEVEELSGSAACYNYTGHKSIRIPDLIYHFGGGAELVVPGKNYFTIEPEDSVACVAFISDNGPVPLEGTPGPSIMLGNYQQVDYYFEYDLINQRLGFRPQAC